jgi:hypothetical protein
MVCARALTHMRHPLHLSAHSYLEGGHSVKARLKQAGEQKDQQQEMGSI